MDKILYIVLPYFNYEGNPFRLINLEYFLERYNKLSNIKIIISEAIYDNSHELSNKYEVFKHLKFKTNQKIWLKENLINLAIKELPSNWEYVSWIDADIEFQNIDWVKDTINSLNDFDVIQMFQKVEYLDLKKRKRKDSHLYWSWNGKNGQPGFCWAIKRKAFDKIHKLFDYNIIGGGDQFLANCFYQNEIFVKNSFKEDFYAYDYPPTSDEYLQQLCSYLEKCKSLKVGKIDGTIFHYWHGHIEKRMYRERWNILYLNKFNPIKDCSFNKDGLIQLNNKDIEKDLKNYFFTKEELKINDKEKILIIQNTDFHMETCYALYDILQKCGYDPRVVFIFQFSKDNLHILSFAIERGMKIIYNESKEKELNIIKNLNFKAFFVITSDFMIRFEKNIKNNFQNINHDIVRYCKDKNTILITHDAFTGKLHKEVYLEYFNNPKFLAVSPFSQKVGIDYFYPTSNFFLQSKSFIFSKIKANEPIKFVFLGRFNRNHRNFSYIEYLDQNLKKIEPLLKRKFQIYLIGDKVSKDYPIKDKEFLIKMGQLTERDFYYTLKDMHYIFNFIDFDNSKNRYYVDAYSCTYGTSIMYQKPIISHNSAALQFPIPGFYFFNQLEFIQKFILAVNIHEDVYFDMVKNFELVQEYHLNHNKMIMDKII